MIGLNTEVTENTEVGIVFGAIDGQLSRARAASDMNSINEITEKIIGAAIEVHREKGPGLLESAYESCLACELSLRGLAWVRQLAVPLTYKGEVIDVAFRADLIVEDAVLIELKAIETVLPVHRAQVLSPYPGDRTSDRSTDQFSRSATRRRHHSLGERPLTSLCVLRDLCV